MHLRNIYIKYLLEKKILKNNDTLRNALYKINKNNILINNNENRRQYLLKKLIQFKDKITKLKLKETFIKFYFKCKILSKQRKSYCFKNFQDDFLKIQKLSYLIYQKEKFNILLLQKYFHRFRINTLIIENNKINNDKRNRKLKLIISKITNHNNIIIKSILKQWLLRSKIIKFRISDNANNNNNVKDEKKENLIKGLNKLNSIFETYTKNIGENDGKNILKKETLNKPEEIKVKDNKSINEIIEKQNNRKKLFLDKYCTDYILEEKDEEQTEDNL